MPFCCLHKGITDGGSHELEAPLLQVPAHSVRFFGHCRDLGNAAKPVLHRLVAGKLPDVGIEGPELLLDLENIFALVIVD